jgi:hypothetical protein
MRNNSRLSEAPTKQHPHDAEYQITLMMMPSVAKACKGDMEKASKTKCHCIYNMRGVIRVN